MATLSLVAGVAKGCGHQQLMKSVIECGVRLVNRSWQHLQQVSKSRCGGRVVLSLLQLSKQVSVEVPLSIHYIALSSLLHLHTHLQALASLHPSP